MKNTTQIKLKNNFKVTFKGAPRLDVKEIKTSTSVGISPLAYKFIKAKLIVKEGEAVQQGQALFFDKKEAQVYFHSPVSGVIKKIVYGPQRRLDLITIDVSSDAALEFSPLKIDETNSVEFKSALLERGLWNGFSEFPFENIPSPSTSPPAIIVPLSNSEPFQPKLSTIIDDVESDIIEGLAWLKKLSDNISVYVDADEQVNLDAISEHVKITRVRGDFAANGAGSFLYNMKTSAKENKAWVCQWQHLVKITRTLNSGQYYNQILTSVGGNQMVDNQHYRVTEGAEISSIITIKDVKDRVICGGLFSGLHIDSPQYLPLGTYALNIIDNDPKTEFLSFMQIGFKKPSFSRAYLSGMVNEALINLKKIPVQLPFLSNIDHSTATSSALNGSHRDCVSCGFCEEVCPVDILPQTLLRNSKVDDVEENMRMGLLDCTTCGACTYVCPSKIDLASTFETMKNNLYKELKA
ncbi:MAG: 4Fe-4S dicluster domain-containing protein [Candidatus Margulisiibacteriota bacterium]